MADVRETRREESMMGYLKTRKVGRSWLGIGCRDRSTLGKGRLRTASGAETVYYVAAMATSGRETVRLADGMTFGQAEAYLAAYSPKFGLITKG